MKTKKDINKILQDHEKRICVLEARMLPSRKQELIKRPGHSDSLVLSIANKIGACGESEAIQNKVLDQTRMEGKILLCFFISHKYFKNAWLTTGEIEEITSALGTKIAVGNVSNKIKDALRKYLESGAVPKQGQPTPYRLNRKGVNRFQEMLRSGKG